MKNLSFLILMFVFSCNTGSSLPEMINHLPTDFKEEIDALKSPSQRSIYLEKIFRTDQKVRKDEQKAIQDFGYDSKEHKAAQHKFRQTDIINFAKIEQFLKTHDYPNENREGMEAAAAPFYVIHHSGDLGYRNRHFSVLYQAYKRGDIQDGEMALYLNRSHEIKFNEMFTMPNPFTRAAQIDSLIKRLDLQIPEN